MSRSATMADVLDGRARWCVVEGDSHAVLPTLPDRSAAHVITDPPYELEAHTLQRRVKRNTGDGLGAKWGGADRRLTVQTPLFRANLRRRAEIGGKGNRQTVAEMDDCLLPSGGGREVV